MDFDFLVNFFKKVILTCIGLFLIQACTVMPQTAGFNTSQVSGDVRLRDIDEHLIESLYLGNVKGNIGCSVGECPEDLEYRVGPGDVLSIVVWEHPQLTLPLGPNKTPSEAGNRVHNDGTIFFPYVGTLNVDGKSLSEIRASISSGLKKVIPNPQVDVSIASFRESNQIYVLGEVKKPGPLVLGMGRLSLTDAIAQSGGVDNSNANVKGILVFRHLPGNTDMDVFKLDARSPASYFWGTKFSLRPQDVVYVTSAPAARWGRIISKVTPSLSALYTLLLLDDRL